MSTPSSGITDLAVGLVLIFAILTALSSVVTELIARFLGLRGAYLLRGLSELLDGDGAVTDLATAQQDYATLQQVVQRGRGAVQRPAAAGTPAEGTQVPAAPEPAAPESAGRTEPAPTATGALLGGPILGRQGMAGQISSRQLTVQSATQPGGPVTVTASSLPRLWSLCRSLPSYIPARSFAAAVIDVMTPGSAADKTMVQAQRSIDALPASMPLKSSMQALANNAGRDFDQFRDSIEHWYDDHMDRVSGQYKRHVAKITLVVGAILVLLLNVNTLTIGRTLYTDSAVSTAVSSVAAKSVSCPASGDEQKCLSGLEAKLAAAASGGLPVGWGTVRACTAQGTACNWLDERGILSPAGSSGWNLALVLIGFLLTIVALVPGSRFWFGLLGKLGSITTSGPKPAKPAA